MKYINRFVGQYSFLSNFHPSTLYLDAKAYKTAEHAYQAQKTDDNELKEAIRIAESPLNAKKLGKSAKLKIDWDSNKINIMRLIIKEKFKNPLLRELLKETAEHKLLHENKFNDKFWGICGGVGENWLGLILEDERESIFRDDANDNK